NAINLSIGVQSSPTALQSRAPLAGHYAMQENTAINLYVEGDWTHSGTTTNIVKKSTYRAVKDDDADNINAIKWKSRDHLYWDDFGTADPDNTANRTKGLGILAVAIDGITNTTVVNLGSAIDWNNFKLDWNLADHTGTIEVVGGTKFLMQDILIANNLYDASVTTPQKRYTFDEQKALATKPEEARLEFQHVLSKVTFNVTAGQGFNGTFWDYPTIYLTRNKTGETADEWCYKNGKIDIKAATATHDGSTLGTVLLNPILRDGSIYTEAAIIYPGSDFGGNNDVIAKINADGNIYYVTAEKIRAAINGTTGHAGDYTTKPGYNYIFNITLNKTDIIVTATVSKWIDVNADEAFPKIVVSANVGNKGDTEQTLSDFRFYRNEGVNVPLFGSSDPVPTAPTTKNVKYTALADAQNPATGADGATAWKFWTIAGTPTETSLYWPNHTTHYFFRGVYPKGTTVADGESSYIVVNNDQYNASKFPSNLMIGAPEIADGTKCDNPDHTAVDMSKYGICARTGAINLNFRYMMSQVEVDLNTTTGDDKVNVAANTVVEIIGCYNAGNVFLGTREVKQTTKADYTLATVTGTGNELKRRSAIVPQPLEGLKFKVTVTNADDTKDVYYSTIKDIRVESKTITEWKSGYHYKYTLTLKKTGISVTATITDWIPANGSDNVWM
ncbi:MAG: fimbrillin family protein, partial [Muribaculaceae bacterium]|nr:fimbrillin family protein [Muribaculaceae bacterium]